MSRRTWVCFDCRRSVRREAGHRGIVRCPECAGDCVDLGHKIPIPRRRNVAAWAELAERRRREVIAREALAHRESVKRKHAVEKEIAKLESRPENPERERVVRRLRRDSSGS